MDTASFNDTETTSNLCTLDNRRSNQEVWLKLFAVHLTTIAALCHVLSLRRGRIFSRKLLAYLLEPASILVAHIPPLLILIFAAIYLIWFDRTRRFGRSIVRAAGLYLASAPKYEDGESSETAETEGLLKRLGRVFLAFIYLTQCCGTIGLFVRRVKHSAATRADFRIVEVASTGALVSIYWILIAARIPAFTKELPTGHPDNNSFNLLERTILLLRGVTFTSDIAWQETAIQIYGNYYLCILVLITKGVWLWHEHPRAERAAWAPNPTIAHLTIGWIQAFIPDVFLIVWHFAGGIWAFGAKSNAEIMTEQRQRPSRMKLAARGIFVIITFAYLKVPVFLPYVYLEWAGIANQLMELQATPVDKACPLLWSDPVANWIWTLG